MNKVLDNLRNIFLTFMIVTIAYLFNGVSNGQQKMKNDLSNSPIAQMSKSGGY